MPLVVYGDVYFLVNFSIDFLVLVFCGKFLRLRRRLWRIGLAALLGGVYAVAVLLFSLAPWQGLLLQFAAAALLCLVAYGFGGCMPFLQLFAGFYGSAVLLGGAVNALYTLLGEIFGLSAGGSVVTDARRAEVFMLYAVISGAVIYLAGRILSRKRQTKTVRVEVESGGRRVAFRGLVDSGNLLTDPLSGRAVILVREAEIAPLLPRGAKGILKGQSTDIPTGERRRLRVVVARGIDGGRTLLGYLPDAVLLAYEESPAGLRAVDAMIAVSDNGERDFSGCAAIVPASLVG